MNIRIHAFLLIVLGLIFNLKTTVFAQGCEPRFDIYKSGLTIAIENKTETATHYPINWYFGDGNTRYDFGVPGDFVHHTFAAPGTYTVCLVDSLCSTKAFTCEEVVVDTAAPFEVSFYDSIIRPGAFLFIPMITVDAKKISWDFGDGATSEDRMAYHQYSGPGAFNVCLAVFDSLGQYNISCRIINVDDKGLCKAMFSTQAMNNGIQFLNYSLGDDTTTQFTWDFGDGSFSNERNPFHRFAGTGSYLVSLKMISALCQDSFFYIVQSPDSLSCAYTFDYSTEAQKVTFNIKNIMDEPGYPSQYYFEFGDGDGAFASGDVAEHIYSNKGTYVVCLYNYLSSCNVSGMMFCDTLVIDSLRPICKANFSVSSNGYTAQVINESKVYGSTLADSYETHLNWGDGSTVKSSYDSVLYEHVYTNQGVYPVTLTVISSLGCADSLTKLIGAGPLYGLEGRVTADGLPATFALVTAYTFEPNSSFLVAVASVQADANGNYRFEGLQYGYYLIQADFAFNPLSTGFFLPTYYGNSIFWNRATVVTMGGARYGVDIELVSYDALDQTGYCEVKGQVVYGEGVASPQGTEIDGSPASNTLIYLMNDQEEMRKYTHSISNGTFSITQLPKGTYYLVAEMAGKISERIPVVVDDARPVMEGIKLVIGKNEITSTAEVRMAIEELKLSTYPNPANESIFVAASFLKEPQMVVMDLLGRQQSVTISRVDNHTWKADIGGLPNGMYMIKTTDVSGKQFVNKFTKSNK